MNHEIKIAGAGLAGMTTAVNLAMAGYHPMVYELRKDVGMRFAGDFQFFENWSKREDVPAFLQSINIKLDLPIEPMKSATAIDARKTQYHFESDRPVGYMIRRGCFDDTLDMALKRQAIRLGVQFEFGRKATPEEVDVVATGPDSRHSYILVQGMTFETDLPDAIWLLFDHQVAPKVYAYLVACRGRGVACTCFTRSYVEAAGREGFLKRALESFQRIRAFEITNVQYFGNYGIGPLITHADKIIVGEAAGFQDANWGFGMRHAMESGFLAARAIIERQDYWRLAKHEIIPWVKSSWANRYIMEKLGDRGNEKLLRILYRRQSPGRDLRLIYAPHIWKNLLSGLIISKGESLSEQNAI